ncbi:MAG: hypothetical protein ABJE66_07585 [Deltaproteobacteria bacterium]
MRRFQLVSLVLISSTFGRADADSDRSIPLEAGEGAIAGIVGAGAVGGIALVACWRCNDSGQVDAVLPGGLGASSDGAMATLVTGRF